MMWKTNTKSCYEDLPHNKVERGYWMYCGLCIGALQWYHMTVYNVSIHWPLNCLSNSLCRLTSKETSKSASLAFMRGTHRGQVDSSHKGPYDGFFMELGHHWFRQWLCTFWAPSHCLNHADVVLIGTSFSEMCFKIKWFSFRKMHLKMSFAKWHFQLHFCEWNL